MARLMTKGTVALLALVATASGCRSSTAKSTPYTTLNAEATALKRAFNADADKVRVVMLVAPS